MPDFVIQTNGRAGNVAPTCELRMATVDNFNSSAGTTLIFDGESSATMKRYKRLEGVYVSQGARVLVAKISGTYIILGRVY